MKALGISNAKTTKGEAKGYSTAILYLLSHREASKVWKSVSPSDRQRAIVAAAITATSAEVDSSLERMNLCPAAGECANVCLLHAGRGRMSNVVAGRLRKTLQFRFDLPSLLEDLRSDLRNHARTSSKKGMIAAGRLNGTSDLPWEKIAPDLFDLGVKLYDYTKIERRAIERPYDLTFSRDERNEAAALRVLESGGRVAVVFRDRLPARYLGVDVIDGDATDLRFLDPAGVVVGLKAKGPAKHDRSGFVVDL